LLCAATMTTTLMTTRRSILTLAMLTGVGCNPAGGPTPDAPLPVDAPSSCPDEPPADGAPCTGFRTCVWDRCPDGAVHTARCVDGSYDVTEEACATHSCIDTTCEAGEICVVRQGGAQLVECRPDPCGDGPIVGACACAACDGFPCTEDSRGVTCNTCTSGICP
jgi:hypothetical protein